jgi:hypothetical protein
MRDGWLGNVALQNALLRADPDASVIVEAIRVVREDVKDVPDDWSAADSPLTGIQVLADGGAKLLGTRETAADGGTSNTDEVITDLDAATPHFAVEVEWGNVGDLSDREIDRLIARLDPDLAGTGVTVTEWRAQLFRLAEVTNPDAITAEWTLQPISARIDVAHAGGTSPSDVTFDFRSRGVSSAVRIGPPPKMTQAGESLATAVSQRTYVFIWAVAGEGEAATNVAWLGDSAQAEKSGVSYTSRHVQLAAIAEESAEQNGSTYSRTVEIGMPNFTLEEITFTEQTISFTGAGNRLDLGASPTDEVEIVASGQTPGGSSLTFEIAVPASGSWVEVFDGDVIGVDNTDEGGADLSGFTPAETYDARVTLTPDNASPIVRRFGVRERERTDLTEIAVLRSYAVAVDPVDLHAEIGQASIEIIKDGITDYRDFFTTLFAENWIGQIEFRAWLGSPNLARHAWMLLDSFLVEDQTSQRASGIVPCVNVLAYLRGIVPLDVAGEREPKEYANELISTARDDLLTGQLEIPGRHIGPGAVDVTIDTDGDGVLDASARVTKRIMEVDGKQEVTALDYLTGGVTIASQGRLKWVRLHHDPAVGPAPHPVAIIPLEEASVDAVSPGYSERVAEFYVPWGWSDAQDQGGGAYAGEVRAFHTQAISKLGITQVRQGIVPRLDDHVAQWIPQSGTTGGGDPVAGLAELIAKRQVASLGMGMITLTVTSTVPHPELEIGDVVAVQTDRFVGRRPTDDRALRGMLWLIGPVVAVHDAMGQRLTIWIRNYEDILPGSAAITRIGYAFPRILEAIPVWDIDGAATLRVRANKPDSGSVRLAADASGFPNEETVRASSVTAVSDEGWAEVSMGGTWVVGTSFWLSGFAYEVDDGTGREQPVMFTQKYKVELLEGRVILTLDLDGDELWAHWTATAPAEQIKWLVDETDAPLEAEVDATGAIDATGSVLIHTFDPSGAKIQRIYFGFFGQDGTPVQVTDLEVKPSTYQVGDNLPTVALIYMGRTTDGDEKWLAVASGQGTNVTLYYRTYDVGSGPPAYTSVGPAADPLAEFFTFAHPADGAANVAIEAYAEDDSTPALVSEVVYRESDSDVFPSGDVDLTTDATNETYATPRAIDTDSLSYRFKAVIAAAGTDAYADPSLANDTDVGVATLVGTGFGTQVQLSAVLSGIVALKDGEELYLSGWTFNCVGTTYTAQAAAVKSSPIQRSIPFGFLRNALKSVWLERRVATYGVFSVVELDLHFQCETDGVKSLLVSVVVGADPAVVTREDIAAKDGVVATVYGFDPDATTVATVTPYDDVSADLGTGNAGPAQETTLPLGSESIRTIITDVDGDGHVTDEILMLSRGLSVGDDPITGQARIGVFFDASVAGVDITGATNNTTEMQSLVDEAFALGGGKIFAGGIVQVSSLTMKKGVEICGDGWGSKLIQAANAHTTIDSGTSTGGNTTSTLNDTGKTWTVDEHKMRTARITSGPLSGEARVITANTATQLTIGMESGVGTDPFGGTPGTITYEILEGLPVVVSESATDGQWGVRNIRIDGNKANQIAYNPGVLLTATPASVEYNDSHQFLDHVLIDNVSGWGLLKGLTCREVSVRDVVIRNSGRHGIFTWPAGGTDNTHHGIVVAHSGLSGIVANGTNDRYSDCKSFGNGQDAATDQGHGWLVTAQGVHGAVLQAQENYSSGFALVFATDCNLDIRSMSNQEAGLKFFDAHNNIIRAQMVGDEGLLYVQPWAVIDTGYPGDPSTNNRIDLVTDDSHATGVVDPDFQDNDNTIQVNNRTKGIVWSTWGALGSQHEHLVFGKDSAPLANEPQYAFKTESDTPASALFESYDLTNIRTYLRFKHTAQELILAYAARVTQVTVDGARLILGTPTVAASGVPVENIGLKEDHYLYGEQTYFGGSWVKLIGFFADGTDYYVDLSPGGYAVKTGGQIDAANVVSVFKDTGEAFRFGKLGAPAGSNPYYMWKHDAGSPPLGLIESYDGTTTRQYMTLDHANDGINLVAAVVAINPSSTLAFFGAGGSGVPTVSGSRGGVAALASLLTGLSGLGLVVDSSSA